MENEKKYMDMKEVFAEMQSDVTDECHDTRKYLKMAHCAEMNGNKELAEYLFLISKDEYSHATFLYKWLSEKDPSILTEEDRKEYHELEAEVGHKFR